MNDNQPDNATAFCSVGQQQVGLAWMKELPAASGWWWIRGLNAHPPVQIVPVQQLCGEWSAMIYNQWRFVADYKRCEWAGPLAEPTDLNSHPTD